MLHGYLSKQLQSHIRKIVIKYIKLKSEFHSIVCIQVCLLKLRLMTKAWFLYYSNDMSRYVGHDISFQFKLSRETFSKNQSNVKFKYLTL